ncbi:HNH endonuclease [Streptomyces sp. A0958]|uniref:HNH endonuclease family protein n=1 Tax=Streptomyces sp. A0958 TaxID=2563101 RepID=UPI00109E7B89|nr:HNH endonuclease family protein [Streptomyces sp. A0958]THA63867.1 HNH endonuclease [Streptomyces sp. A0958]
MKRVLPTAAVALSALVACSSSATSSTDDKQPPADSISAVEAAAGPGEQLDELTVAARGSMDGYSRDKYPHWIDQGDSCNTREAVLKRDGKDVKTGSDCYPTSGTWKSPYDGATWTDPSDVDIDHMVPLGNSWVSGAKKWTNAERQAFANDLTNPQLFAVTDNVNQSKSDKAPDKWRPPLKSYWCQYSTDWIEVKHHYKLTVTTEEKAALKDMLATC